MKKRTPRVTLCLTGCKAALLILVGLILFTVPGCSDRAASSVHAKAYVAKLQCIQTGIASWYGKHMKGKLTASGEKYDPKLLTAASRKYPMGTELNVIDLKNDRNVTVTVNDRGPYSGNRVIDMSVAAAGELNMKKTGTAPVCVQPAQREDSKKD